MSRGVVLWPDDETSRAVTNLWASLEAAGIPTLARHTHGRRRPHVSLVVADDLSPSEALGVLRPLPRKPLRLILNSPGFFPGGVLFLACVPTSELLEEHRIVHGLVAGVTRDPCAYYAPGAWTPHVTISYGLSDEQLTRALPVALDRLPIEGWLTSGGVEDGRSGERWPAGGPTTGQMTG
jgi:hypothetical protein